MQLTPEMLREHLDRPDLMLLGGIGLTMPVIENGYAEGRIPVTDAIKNPIGSVHGGIFFALADNVAGTAAVSTGAAITTSSCDLHFLNAALNANELICKASVIKNGSRLCVMKAEVFDEKDTLLCSGTLTYAKIGPAEALMN